MAYVSDSFMFRSLDDTEEAQFREYARTNPPIDHWEVAHPVCREVWAKRGYEPFPDDKSEMSHDERAQRMAIRNAYLADTPETIEREIDNRLDQKQVLQARALRELLAEIVAETQPA